MDPQDFDVTVIDTLDLIDRSIEAMALDRVECYPGDGELKLEFKDMSFFLLTAEKDEQLLVLHTPGRQYRMRWDKVEEQWIENDGPLDLFRLLSREMSRHLESDFTLQEAE